MYTLTWPLVVSVPFYRWVTISGCKNKRGKRSPRRKWQVLKLWSCKRCKKDGLIIDYDTKLQAAFQMLNSSRKQREVKRSLPHWHFQKLSLSWLKEKCQVFLATDVYIWGTFILSIVYNPLWLASRVTGQRGKQQQIRDIVYNGGLWVWHESISDLIFSKNKYKHGSQSEITTLNKNTYYGKSV